MKIEKLWEEFRKLETKYSNPVTADQYEGALSEIESERFNQETNLDKELIAVFHNALLLMEAVNHQDHQEYYKNEGNRIFSEIQRKIDRISQLKLLKKEFSQIDGSNSYQRMRLHRINSKELQSMHRKLSNFNKKTQLIKS